ncbi:elongation factor-like GTPase 1 [Epargyreus clarus]|uniref:elongation factor-like GTPase 1 n=1 Tax=Epargyreus clarus TaxID=520877 RepID=UPI003C2D8A70
MRLVDSTKLLELQHEPTKIRNICIVAHVDHGKTTLADSLISSNGIISQRMSGKLRYMDSRPDEQERGITMKSSSISLYHAVEGQEYLVNLIDSPGHIDFSSEVSTAVRLCDGAIVVVDVVEGVCPQTRLALKQAYSENIKAVLVLNKIDRLILEMKMTALDAYLHMTQVLEQVNAVTGELFASEVLENEETLIDKQEQKPQEKEENSYYDWTSALEDADDSNLYFSPEQGNVVFASAIDGWGFTTHTFAKLFSDKLGVREEILRKVLWGDFYLNAKAKRFMKGAQEKAKKPLFVQVVLDNLWNVYETIALRNEKDKVPVICEKLGIKLTTRDLRHTDSRIQLQSLMMQWLPLSNTVLNMVCTKLPSPKEILAEKVEKLMCSRIRDFESYHPDTMKLKHDFLACDSSDERPLIVFISKMFSVDKSSLPENKPKMLTAEEMAIRRERARQLREESKQTNVNLETEKKQKEDNENDLEKCAEDEKEKEDKDQPAFIAFARIFSGKLKKGAKVYVLGPKHDPSKVLNVKDFNIDPDKKLKDLQSDEHITYAEVKSLYILMGRELEDIDEAVAGNIIGIGGLEDHILKTATLSSTIACPAFSEIQYAAVPILRVALEPTYPSQLPQLVKGLKLLNQSDSCVQVLLQETGEHVLVTAGEVHLQRCLEDLKNIYAKIPISVSEPIVPFRETIVEPPKVDMANEEIDAQNVNKVNDSDQDPVVNIQTNNKQSRIKIRARPLPREITDLLERSSDLLKAISQHIKSLQNTCKQDIIDKAVEKLNINDKNQLSERMLKLIEAFKSELNSICSKHGPDWKDIVNQIWSVGPRNCGPNVLLNQTSDYTTRYLYHEKEFQEDPRFEYEGSFVNGFQLASLAGPLCEEPMMGVAFCVEEWSLDKNEGDDVSNTFGPLSGQIMSAVKEGCRRAFQLQPQRLVAAMYSCDIVVDQKVLGKLYAELGRRGGRVVGSDLQSGSSSFRVRAMMPVAESFKFAIELRTHTSGLAAPQLMFSHWEVIDIDPFWTPRTEEEYLHWGEKWDGVNRAKAYMDSVRARKGLATDKQLVQHAEKQRTLSKKK